MSRLTSLSETRPRCRGVLPEAAASGDGTSLRASRRRTFGLNRSKIIEAIERLRDATLSLLSALKCSSSLASLFDSLAKIADFLLNSEKEDCGFLIDTGYVGAVLELMAAGCAEDLQVAEGVAEEVLEVFVAIKDDPELGFPAMCFRPMAEREAGLSRLFRLMCAKGNFRAIKFGLSCLIVVVGRRKMRSPVVRLGIVPILGRLLMSRASNGAIVEKALKMLETVSTCPDERRAICDDDECIAAIVQRMLKSISIND
ncbi:hypothetical protein ACLOJK_034567 [Asimina triloba]